MSDLNRNNYLAREQSRIQERRGNYSIEQMVHELEANAERQRQVCLHGSTPSEGHVPVARQCNTDNYNISRAWYYDVGDMTWECMYCQALGFKDENKGSESSIHVGKRCCNKGKVILERFPDLPPSLLELYQSSTKEAKYFSNNIRYFYSGMAFSCVMVTYKTIKKYGPASFKIAWKEGCTNPHCMQTYFHDPDYQATHQATRGRPDVSKANDQILRVDIFYGTT